MRPIVVSETIQEFGGERFYRGGQNPYFRGRSRLLHRIVWIYHNGPIPDGAHIHHQDGDRSNNVIENLECLTPKEHLGGRHGEANGIRGKRSIAKANAAASRWHGSDAGRQWHSEHFERHIRPLMVERVPAICQQCGAEYLVVVARVRQGKFCGPNCKARALRKRRRGG